MAFHSRATSSYQTADRYLVYGITTGGVTTYYTKNLRTLGIEYSGANGTTAIQTALTAMATADATGLIGGVCRILGQITIDQAQGPVVYSGSCLAGTAQVTDQPSGTGDGQHQGSCLVPTPNCTGPVVTLTGNPNFGVSEAFPAIKDLTISGSTTTVAAGGSGQHGIQIDDSGVVPPATTLLDTLVWNTSVFNVGGWGIYVNTGAKVTIGGNWYLERCNQGAILCVPGKHGAIWVGSDGIGNVSASPQTGGANYAIDCDQAASAKIKGVRFTGNSGGGVRMQKMTGEAALILGCTFIDNGGSTIPQVALGKSSATTIQDMLVAGNQFYDDRSAGTCALNHIGLDPANQGTALRGFIDGNTFAFSSSTGLTLANGNPAIGGNSAQSNKPYATSTFAIGFNRGYNDKVGKLTSPLDISNLAKTTASGVNAINSASVNVVNAANFATAGTFMLGGTPTDYTGKSGNTLTGCGNHAATTGGETITNLTDPTAAPGTFGAIMTDSFGTTAVPFPNQNYVNIGSAKELYVTGGAGVSITIKDPARNTIQSGVATLTAYVLRPLWTINFGTFGVAANAPTVVAVVV